MTSVIRMTLRSEIEITREIFQRLLVIIPEAALKFPSQDPAWTNGELLYRMSIAPLIIKSTLRKNRSVNSRRSTIPQIVTGPLIQRTTEMVIRSRARTLTRESIAVEYNQTCTMVLEMLDGIPDDGFERKLIVFEDDPLLPKPATVEQLFHYVLNHFETHRKQINPGK